MNRIILLGAFLVASSTLVLSQATMEQGVHQTLDKMQAVLQSNDVTTYATILSDDYTFVSPQGVMLNKTQRLEGMRSGQVKYESFTYEDVKIRLYGNTAVVNAKANVKMTGTDASTALVTLVFVKKASQWLLVAAQATPPAK